MSRDREVIAIDKIAEQIKLPKQNIIQKLSEKLEGVIKIKGGSIYIPKKQKMKLVNKAISLGVNSEQIIETLHWREFENFCLIVLDHNDYETIQNFHFSLNKRRYEIDVIGIQKHLIFAIDAKKWKAGCSSALKKMVNNQINRVKAFTKSLQKHKIRLKLNLKLWHHISIIPMIVTSKEYEIKIFKRVPIIPFCKLNQFINEIYRYFGMILYFSAKLPIQKTLFP